MAGCCLPIQYCFTSLTPESKPSCSAPLAMEPRNSLKKNPRTKTYRPAPARAPPKHRCQTSLISQHPTNYSPGIIFKQTWKQRQRTRDFPETTRQLKSFWVLQPLPGHTQSS